MYPLWGRRTPLISPDLINKKKREEEKTYNVLFYDPWALGQDPTTKGTRIRCKRKNDLREMCC